MNIRPDIKPSTFRLTVSSAVRAHYLAGTANTKQRSAWDDYGYPAEVTFEMLYQMHKRNGLARAGNEIPPELCWKTTPRIFEGKEAPDKPTTWEQQLADVFDRHSLFKALYAADRRQRVGQYGALIVQIAGTAEQADWSKPLDKITADNIVRLIPCYEEQLKPDQWEQDRSSIRFGLPTAYQYNERAVGNSNQTKPAQPATVHWSRVIVVAEGADDGTIYGSPANEAGFNDLLTLELISGAGGQGFWKNAAGKLHFDLDATAQPTAADIDAQKAMIEEFATGLDKHLVTGGLKSNVLNFDLADPEPFHRVALQQYAASVRIPVNRLIGSVTGVLAGDKDDAAFLQAMQSRRLNVCVHFVNKMVDWLIAHGVVPAVQRYTVEFDDLLAPSEDAKLTLGEKMARINQINTLGGAVFSAEEIRQVCGHTGPAPDDIEPDELTDTEGGDDPADA